MRNQKLSNMLKATLMGVIGFILMLFEFPLVIFPSFLTFDFSDTISVITGFALGPIGGVISVLIRNLLHLFVTKTAGVGELANFIIGSAIVIPSSIIYYRNKTKLNAIIGLITGAVFMICIGALFNYFVLIPFFAKTVVPLEVIINLANAINSNVVNLKTFILYVIVPMNIIKSFVTFLLTIALYKYISKILKI